VFTSYRIQAQVGIGTTTPVGSAQLDVNSISKGFLPPRMTSAQRGNITSPVAGLMVYQTDGISGIYYYNGSAWIYILNSTNHILPVTNGGTGQTTANAALNALVPSQTGNANKVLVTDGTNVSWNTNIALTSAVLGIMASGAYNSVSNTWTGASITLPPGKWSVSVSMLGLILAGGNFWVQTGFSASTSNIVLGADAVLGGPSLISGLVIGNANNMINGTVIINNTSGTSKTYYYCTAATSGQTLVNLGRNTYGENTIIAYPMN
jgi:hypothetical protein